MVATRRPSTCGARDRLTPIPTTTASPARSSSIPASFARPTIRSFGHFNSALGGSAIRGATTSCKARPATSARVPAGGSPGLRWTTQEPMKLPLPSNHARPCRPRPATCRSATSQWPSGTFSPPARRARRSVLVDPVSGMTSIKVPRLRRQTTWNSAAAAFAAKPSSHLVAR